MGTIEYYFHFIFYFIVYLAEGEISDKIKLHDLRGEYISPLLVRGVQFFFFFFTVVPFFWCNIWYHLASLLLILEKNITQKTSTKYKRIVIVSILYNMRLRGETASLVSMRIEERNERRRPNLLYVNLRIKIFINSLRSFFLAVRIWCVRGAKREKRKKNGSIAKSTTTKRERALWKKRL